MKKLLLFIFLTCNSVIFGQNCNCDSLFTESQKIVTVSDIKGFAEDGGMIELVHNEGVVKLKINVTVAKQSGIIINSDLLALSTIIQ